MIQIMLRFFILFLIVGNLFAEAPPIVLEDRKEFYEIGLNLDILEDPAGKLTIDDVTGAKWKGKFKRSKDKVPNFGMSDSTFWARLRIQNRSQIKKWILLAHV